MAKLTVRELKKIEKGLKKVVEASEKFGVLHKLHMSSFQSCALGTFLGTVNGWNWHERTAELFAFSIPLSISSVNQSNLSNIQKDVSRLFVSGGFGTNNTITVFLWRKEANKVLARVSKKLKKRAKKESLNA